MGTDLATGIVQKIIIRKRDLVSRTYVGNDKFPMENILESLQKELDLVVFWNLEALGMMHWQDSGMLFASTDIGLECALFWYLFRGNFLFLCTDVIFTQFIQILVSGLAWLILGMTTRLFSFLIFIPLHRLIF